MIYHSKIRENFETIVNKSQETMRKIVGQYITKNGELKAIYSVHGATMRPKDILFGHYYEIAYTLGRGTAYLNAKLISSTDDFRTLFFQNPDNPNKTIGIPIMSIKRFYLK